MVCKNELIWSYHTLSSYLICLTWHSRQHSRAFGIWRRWRPCPALSRFNLGSCWLEIRQKVVVLEQWWHLACASGCRSISSTSHPGNLHIWKLCSIIMYGNPWVCTNDFFVAHENGMTSGHEPLSCPFFWKTAQMLVKLCERVHLGMKNSMKMPKQDGKLTMFLSFTCHASYTQLLYVTVMKLHFHVMQCHSSDLSQSQHDLAILSPSHLQLCSTLVSLRQSPRAATQSVQKQGAGSH